MDCEAFVGQDMDPWKFHDELLNNDEISVEEQGLIIGWLRDSMDDGIDI